MRQLIEILVSLTAMFGVLIFVDMIKDHEKRLRHLESVTFESSRCPDNKTFSLINLRS